MSAYIAAGIALVLLGAAAGLGLATYIASRDPTAERRRTHRVGHTPERRKHRS